MHRRILVTLLETVVLLDVVEVVLTDDDGVLHLGRLDHPRDQLAPNVHIACAGRQPDSALRESESKQLEVVRKNISGQSNNA